MELTLGIPCQALLIFDSDFADDLFSLALTALAITPAPAIEARTAETARLNHINSFKKLHEELDKHTYLRGRYIVLPNVSEGGTTTLLRAGHSGHYAEMPCVGGYLDGDISQLGEGNKSILSGANPQYGRKALGLFQTSDNRQRDLALLGQHATWVKWARPTAEALRQACLARQSRLAQTAPLLPATTISRIDVSNSAFLGPIVLDLNPQYNAMIGGRGTGKSTILEYLRWALCDASAIENERDDQAKRQRLVDETLKPLDSVVHVHLTVNGVTHVVRRRAATGELALRIGEGAYEGCSEADVRALLPVQAYSQKELSGVGTRQDELRRFVTAPIRQALDEFGDRLTAIGNELRTAYSALRTKRQIQLAVETDEREVRSIAEQTAALRRELEGVSEEDRRILEAHQSWERSADIVATLKGAIGRAEEAMRTASGELAAVREFEIPADLSEVPEGEALRPLFVLVRTRATAAEDALKSELAALAPEDGEIGTFATGIQYWRGLYDAFQGSYEAAKARSSTHQARLEQLSKLEERSKMVRVRLSERQSELSSVGRPEEQVDLLHQSWSDLHHERSDLIAGQCSALTGLSGEQIRASVVRGGSPDLLLEKLKGAFAGTGAHRAKIERLLDGVAGSARPIEALKPLLDELELLSRSTQDVSEGRIPRLPLLRAAGFSDRELQKLTERLSGDVWLDIAVAPIDDLPVFEYRLREGQYLPFERASAGQQATALLWALLNQQGPPLVIDQPEDDLDNQILLDVVGELWKAKERRQLIFASHNANLVVNGDADLVVCCDYRVVGEQAGGRIKLEGAIDVPTVRDEIATVMEGGRAAFSLRKEKYGF